MREGAAGIERRGRWRPRVRLLVLGIAVGFSGDERSSCEALAAVLVLLASVLLVPFALQPVARVVGGATSPPGPRHRLDRGPAPREGAEPQRVHARARDGRAGHADHRGGRERRHVPHPHQRSSSARPVGSLQVIAPGAFEPDVGGRLAAIDGVRRRHPGPFGQTDRLIDDGSQRVDVTVIDPATYFDVAGFAWVDGDDESAAAALSAGGAVLAPGRHGGGGRRGPRRRRPAAHERRGGGVHRRGHVRRDRTRVRRRGRHTRTRPGSGPDAPTPSSSTRRTASTRARSSTRSATELGAEYDLIIDTPDSTKDFAFGQLRGFFSLAYVILVAAAAAGLLGPGQHAGRVGAGPHPRDRRAPVGRHAARPDPSDGARRGRSRSPWSAFVLALPLGLLLTVGTSAAVPRRHRRVGRAHRCRGGSSCRCSS